MFLLALLSSIPVASFASLQSEEAKLLPPKPEGWAYERLDFPLSFAPALDYRGFEELYFAPRMFEAGSPDYFSYAFAVELAGDVDVDVEFWRSFLEQYYRGLCKAVGEDRGLEIDPAAIVVKLTELDDHVTSATIDMVDAFVTGGPLKLRMELSSYPRPRTTELFTIASPQERTAPIWKSLEALRESWRAARPMPVYLNHVYVVPDRATYDALAASEFLREESNEFDVHELRKTVRRDGSYEGLYWYGEETYFEFLAPGEAGLAEGSFGIAFGVESPGGAAVVRDRLVAAGVPTSVVSITRELEGEHVPWFEMWGSESAHAKSRLSLFGLEYDRRFLEQWHSDLPPERPSITRRSVLKRYAAKLAPETEPLFEDVTEIYLELDSRERARLAATCRAFGYETNEGDATVYLGPRVRIVVRGTEGTGQMTGFRMSLRRDVQPREVTFGRARLKLHQRVVTLALDA